MANDLTGDYDVVAQFTVPAANRVLAAMHRGNRFPHSLSLRVDDQQDSKTARSIVDLSGKALADPGLVSRTAFHAPLPSGAATSIIFQNIDPVVNQPPKIVGLGDFGHLKGIAQLQLGAPTITLPDDSSASATVHTPVMVRYFSDPDTMILPDFFRGEIQTTLAAQEVSSAGGNVIDVNVVGPGGNIHFQQFSTPPLNRLQLTAVNKALFNSFVTSFQPSNTKVDPNSNIRNMQLKTLPGTLAVLMNLADNFGAPDPGSVQNVILADGDQFALAVNGDSIVNPFTDAVNTAIDPFRSSVLTQNFAVTVDLLFSSGTFTFSVSATTTVGRATIELQDAAVGAKFDGITAVVEIAIAAAAAAAAGGTGQILLTIPVHVDFSSDSSLIQTPPSFDFTISQAFTLSMNGGAVGIQTLGDLAIIGVPDQVAFRVSGTFLGVDIGFTENVILGARVRGDAKRLFQNALANSFDQINAKVGSALGAGTLQTFIGKLMNPDTPAPKSGTPAQKLPVEVEPQLSYTSFQITTAGVTLHGMLAVVPDWPNPNVEFDLMDWTAALPHPEYNAVNSWIPGGTVQDYVWIYSGVPVPPDRDQFVSSNAPALGYAPKSVCVMIEGSRISSSGPVVEQKVGGATLCKSTSVPNMSKTLFGGGPIPDAAVSRFSVDGKLQIMGHTSPVASADGPPLGKANFIIHFPDDQSVANLDFLTRALQESGRKTATGILCVLADGQAAKVQPPDESLIFADDAAGWEQLLQVKSRPATFVIDTSGRVVHQAGALTGADLAPALQEHLDSGGIFNPRIVEISLAVEQRAPNFIFEYSPGRGTTLRKLAGRPAVLVFWKSSSQPSLDTLANLEKVFSAMGAQAPALLAIDGGDGAGGARDGSCAIVVPDPEGDISSAYGVSIWPTVISLDADGMVTDIRYGLISEEQTKPHADRLGTTA